jgi:phage terminase Nu1 subunit (DNA packaging protein)
VAAADANALTVDQIAGVLKLKQRRVQQLVDVGVLPRAERGRYALIPCVHAYIDYLRGDAEGDDDAAGKTGIAKESATAKTRMIQARARMAELEADQLDGSMLPRALVERAWADITLTVRSRLLLVPNRAAPLAHAALSVPEAAAAITSALHDALGDLARIPLYEPAGSAGKATALGAGRAAALGAAAGPDDIGMG